MTQENRVYRCQLAYSLTASPHWYLQEGTATSVALDGQPMVRIHNVLLPAEGWHESERDAKAAIADRLVRIVGIIQAEIDTLRDDVLHADLATEERAA